MTRSEPRREIASRTTLILIEYLVQSALSVPCTKRWTGAGSELLLSSESIVDFNVAAFVGYTEELATLPAGLIT